MALFKGDNRNESISMVIGIVVLILGMALLMVGFVMAYNIATNPSGFLRSQIPEVTQETAKGPRAQFDYTIEGFNVTVVDRSQAGDAAITSWHWEFGGGATSNQQNPPRYTYTTSFTGTIRLTVRDGNDKENSAIGEIQVPVSSTTTGNSMSDFGDVGNLDFSALVEPLMAVLVGLAAATVTFFMLFIMWLAGASITKAGWNMIRPRPETIRVRIKSKDLQVEPVYPTTYAVQPQMAQTAPPLQASEVPQPPVPQPPPPPV